MTRRRFLAGCAAGSAALLAPLAGATDADALPDRVLFDSRMAMSAAFAREAAARGVPCIDVASQDAQLWRGVRHELRPQAGRAIVGVCRWSDWVGIRGALSEHRLRVRSERRLADGGFAWSMA